MSDAEFGICTNYKLFILIIREYGTSKYHQFDFATIANDELRLKEFVCIFSKQYIENDFAIDLQTKSIIEEKEFTEEFYKLFHETRLMLIKTFQKNGLEKSTAIHTTQIFLNRLIFIFFVEDQEFLENKRLFCDNILNILNSGQIKEHSRKIYSEITELFLSFDKGSDNPKIFGFNGGLFSGTFPEKMYFNDLEEKSFFKDVLQHSTIKEEASFDDTLKIISEISNLNPIIFNLLLLDSFDFNTEVNVNILGHIFEQSISDLEELSGNVQSKRKNEGVYYTPEYITDYICRNTIIPYLSKSGKVSEPHLLIDEYGDDIETLEQKFRDIKILDPACGSGAFLVKSVDILLEIHKEIQDYKLSKGKYLSGDQFTLTKWNEESEIRAYIENNIFGVDISPQSVEITRLSMFFKTASDTRKLPNLSKNIKVGNSLIRNASISSNAFVWEDEFPNIFIDSNLRKNIDIEHADGFSVIVGNPPYVQYKLFKKDIQSMQLPKINSLILEKDFQIPVMSDLSFYFYYHSLDLLKTGGKLGFIVTDTWLQVNAGKALRKTIRDNTIMEKIFKMAYNVFSGALVKTAISIFEKNTDNKNHKVELASLTDEGMLQLLTFPTHRILQSSFEDDKWLKYFSSKLPVPEIKMRCLKDLGIVKKGMLTGYNPFFMVNEDIIKKFDIPAKYLVPVVSKEVDGCYIDDNDFGVYLLKVNEPKGVLLKTKEGKKILKYIEHGEDTEVLAKGQKELKKIPKLYNLVRRNVWYSLPLKNPAPILIRRTIHRFPTIYENNNKFYTTDGYIEFTPYNLKYTKAYLAYMVSSFFALLLEDIGHAAGGGALSLVPNNIKIAQAPDFDSLSPKTIDNLNKSWEKYRQDTNRDKLNDIVSAELGFEDRHQIDELLDIQTKRRLKKTSNS